MSIRTLAALGAGVIALVPAIATASSVDISFTRIEPHNAGVNPASQLKATLSDIAGQPNKVNFRITNNVGIYCSIMEVYYDDRNGFMSTLQTPLQQNGCSFTGGGANPGNVPGGTNVGFQATTMFSADAGSGGPTQGIDTATDWLDMTFTLAGSNTYQTIVNALSSGSLRMAFHVISINNGNSDSFVSQGFTPPSVPLPAGVYGGMAGLAMVAGVKRLRRRG